MPSGVPTGNPPWWAEMKLQAQQRRILRQTSPESLDAINERLARSLEAEGFVNVWDLSQAGNSSHFSRVRGLGPVTLRRIWIELVRKNVPVKREVPK